MEKLLQKIISKAYEINENTVHTVFVDFSGHVELFEIKVYLNGWKEYKEVDIKLEVYLDEKHAKAELQHMLDKLEELEMKENV